MDMEVEYEISGKLQEQLFVKGEDATKRRIFEFNSAELSEEGRRNWLELFGLSQRGLLRRFKIEGGTIYSDGSVDETPPYLDFSFQYLELDWLITSIGDLEKALTTLIEQKRQLEKQIPQKKTEWETAKAKWETIKAERQKLEKLKAEAKQEAREETEKLKRRISELEGYLRALIRVCSEETLRKAGLIHGGEEAEEELTPEQIEALETCGIGDC